MAKKNFQILIEIMNRLPEFCSKFIYEGQSEHSQLTRLNYARDIEYFFITAKEIYPYFCDKDVKDLTIEDIKKITTSDINLYLTVMKEMYELGEKTRSRRKSSISGLFNYLVNTEKLLDFNPIAGSSKVKLPEKNYVTYLNLKEQEKLLNTIMYGTGLTDGQLKYKDLYTKRDLAIIFLFLDTGLRISELQGANINDVDLYECCIHVFRKGNKEQKVYFSDESKEYINEYLEERKTLHGYTPDEPLFLSNRNNRIAVRTIQAMLEKYIKASLPEKTEHISPHKLRSSFAMEFYKNSKDILLLQQRMGHKTIVATNVYAKASENELIANSRNWRNS